MAVFRVNAAVISEGVVKFNYNAAQINLEAMLGKKMAEILQSGGISFLSASTAES